MPGRTCPQCGNALPDGAKFCGQCGAVTEGAPAPAPVRPAAADMPIKGARTVLGFTSPLAQPGAPAQPAQAAPPPAAQPVQAAPPPAAQPVQAGPPPAAQPAGGGSLGAAGARTMLGFMAPPDLRGLQAPQAAQSAAPPAQAGPPPAQPAHAPAPTQPMQAHPAPAQVPSTPAGGGLAAKTMLGFVAPPDIRAAQAQAPAPAQPQPFTQQPPAQPQPQQPAAPQPGLMKTMLGVAMPGIAPQLASAPQQPQQPQQPPGPQGSRTMLGVAVPGIAPTHSSAPAPAQPRVGQTMLGVAAPRMPDEPLPAIVPAPAPLNFSEAAPAPPVITRKRGAPIAVVAGIIAALVLVGGVLLAVLWHGSSPLVASPQVGPQGNEQLHLTCESCADGTAVTLGASKATFKNHQADLDLPSPLVVGENPLQLAVNRPGVGRDETVKLSVPVSYRIRGDVSAVNADPPAIKVNVEAEPGMSVTLDGKPVKLDASGKATVSYDVTADVTGLSDVSRTIERTLPYVVTPKKGKEQKGEVTVKVSVVPLHLDAPAEGMVTDAASVWVAGRTAKGGHVTVDGADAPAAADGTFETKVDLAPGEHTFVVVGSAAKGKSTPASRTAKITLKRVSSLDEEAAAIEKTSPLAYDAMAADIAGNAGKTAVVEGDVVEARTTHHQTVIVLDDKRGCAHGPCIARVVWGGEPAPRTGDKVRAYGRVTRPFSGADGKVVPELQATLLIAGTKR